MSTTVIVKANHGWPVSVQPLSVDGSAVGPRQRGDAGAEGSFVVHSGQDLLIHEIQPAESKNPDPTDSILQFFAFEHLPPHLQVVSRPFCMIAHRVAQALPKNAERSVALRKLLEAKDAAVRALVAV